MFRNRNFSELMPLAGAMGALTLGLVCLLLGFGSLYHWIDKHDNEKFSSSGSAKLPPMSEYAAAIATMDAAPVRTAQPRAVSQASSNSSGDLGYDAAVVAQGQELFIATCSACHGVDAHGVVGLGKDLINSEFVHSQTDADLMNFIKTGRPIWDAANTTGIDMPPKGGNPALTDEQLTLIITFIRASSGVPAASGGEVVAATETAPDTVAVVPTTSSNPTTAPTIEPTAAPSENTNVSASLVTEGQALFVATCSACHGPDAHGIVGLGKDLINSEFVHSQTDADLLTFVKTGRPIWDAANTTGIDMPPKGGNPALTDEQILKIIAYIRGSSDAPVASGGDVVNAASDTPVAPIVEPTTAPVEDTTVNESLVSEGQALFVATCSACHGPDAHGIVGLGKDLVVSEFVHGLTDADLLTFVKTGRPLWDAANTTGIDMPPRGGNPALTDDQILKIIAYIRSLQNPESGS